MLRTNTVVKTMSSMRRCLAQSQWYTRSYADGNVNVIKKYTPRRAMMYVPGNDWKKINKIPSLKADSFILDCEDGVALNRKEEARNNIKKIFQEQMFPEGKSELSVRVNSIDSGLCKADLEAVLKGPNFPSTLHLPKMESKNQLDWLAQELESLLGKEHNIKLIVFVESARSLLDMKELIQHSFTLMNQGAPFTLEAAIFGSDDFCADIGATRTPEAKELLYSRQYFVTCAKAYRLQAIDLVYINFKNIDGLFRQSLEGAQMGFTGKQVIHPSQIEVVQQAFSPSIEKMQWARELIQSFEAHQQSGKGAFTFHGHMIDMPLLLQARNILQMAENLNQ
ncbi:citramalyl-CoA lyase, mitochondrial-like [Daphnia pulex]|uniref:citramalyl-CoA lyase, mitochondrial-like n=1 Tax=Daphnia pulex TaxID=6669 RepID=UPI001EE0CEE3|nr:citramalyl-CoA lyase, mitochondrial-like [Daphnia pulex]